MYKNKEQQKEYNRGRMAKVRQGNTKGNTSGNTKPSKCVTLDDKNVLPECPETVTLSDGQIWHPDPRYWHPRPAKEESGYPAIVQAITDPVQRKRLEAITGELKARGLGGNVRYGVNGIDFNAVGELLDCVKL